MNKRIKIMNKITKLPSFDKNGIFMAFLILYSIFFSANAITRKEWNRDYMKVTYDAANEAIVMKFEFYDYNYTPKKEVGYLEWCKFAYSPDGSSYTDLMITDTKYQNSTHCTWLNLTNKLPGAALQFIDCIVPVSGTWWVDYTNVQATVKCARNKAFFTVKWYPGINYQYVRDMYIRIDGRWHIAGLAGSQSISEIYHVNTVFSHPMKSEYLNDSISTSETGINTKISEKNAVKVYKVADAINIKGADLGDNIKIYTNSGEQIKSFVTNNEVVKIKLPKNQIYILKIGQTSYKIAL